MIGAHAVSDSAALQPMLASGAGIGQLPDFIARDAVARGALVRLFPETRGDAYSVHALYPSHRSLSAKVRVFIDALVEHLATRHPADPELRQTGVRFAARDRGER